MTNKEKLKQAIEQDMNSKDYYNGIINKIEKGENMKKKINGIWKLSFVPICLIVLISGVILLNKGHETETLLNNKPYVDEKNRVILNINEINDKVGMAKVDADVKIVTNNAINFPLPYKDGLVNIPKDLNKTYKYIFYFRENKESQEYNVLGNYELIYSNDNDRSINVKYSKDNKPVRDYYFSDEGSKITTINDVELKIYKYENMYFTEFNFDDYNFDIETSNLSEQELSNLLLSIIK